MGSIVAVRIGSFGLGRVLQELCNIGLVFFDRESHVSNGIRFQRTAVDLFFECLQHQTTVAVASKDVLNQGGRIGNRIRLGWLDTCIGWYLRRHDIGFAAWRWHHCGRIRFGVGRRDGLWSRSNLVCSSSRGCLLLLLRCLELLDEWHDIRCSLTKTLGRFFSCLFVANIVPQGVISHGQIRLGKEASGRIEGTPDLNNFHGNLGFVGLGCSKVSNLVFVDQLTEANVANVVIGTTTTTTHNVV
mmetsp:Transcript_7554/g.11638  ORF Transcript_7554/g.11638 Transcript_7554/m.11638 type:complete len:244 (-) Transcript_7554:258-989(-)